MDFEIQREAEFGRADVDPGLRQHQKVQGPDRASGAGLRLHRQLPHQSRRKGQAHESLPMSRCRWRWLAQQAGDIRRLQESLLPIISPRRSQPSHGLGRCQ